MPGVSLCICTKDRPHELRRVLQSIADGIELPEVVLVSSDSADPEATRLVCEPYPFVRLLSGPRRGLCANRNFLVSQATTEFLSLLDDDAIVSPGFVQELRRTLAQLAPRVVVTGDVVEDGRLITPNNPSFLGHFRRAPAGQFRNINLNCNCFPASAFAAAHFDEELIYGYEDMDLCSQLLTQGYTIVHDAKLRNVHAPPPRTHAVDRRRYSLAEQARFFTSMKRYLVWERKPFRALLYAVVAPLHRAAHDLLVRRFDDLRLIPSDLASAMRYVLRSRRSRSRGAAAVAAPAARH